MRRRPRALAELAAEAASMPGASGGHQKSDNVSFFIPEDHQLDVVTLGSWTAQRACPALPSPLPKKEVGNGQVAAGMRP